MQWWREDCFGMFIHSGLYSIPAGTWNVKQIPGIGEWIMNNGFIPVAKHKALAPQFNPTSFSARDIVALPKAEAKYLISAALENGQKVERNVADDTGAQTLTPDCQQACKDCKNGDENHRLKAFIRMPGTEDDGLCEDS
jgi:Alpha-L-fucosidase